MTITAACTPVDPDVDVQLTWTDPDTSETVTLLLPWNCSDDPDTPWWWSEMTWPFFDYIYDYAPTSKWLPGQVLRSAVPGPASLPISLVVRTPAADGQAGLTAAKATIEAAFRAVDLTISFLIDTVPVGAWQADPARINWGPVNILALGMFAQEGSVAVPVNPVEAT
jgi:hypothetical protein